MKSLKNEIKKQVREKIDGALPNISEFNKASVVKKQHLLPTILIPSGVLVVMAAIILPLALSNVPNSENKTDVSSNHITTQKDGMRPFYDEYAFDEYYCETDDSYIILYENGYFAYESEEINFTQPYSLGDGLLIVQNYFVVGDPDDKSSHKVDLMFFDIANNLIVCNSELSIFSTDFSLNNKTFVLSRKAVADNAKCRYTRAIANNLIVSCSLNVDLDDVDSFLESQNLSSYSAYVNYTNTRDIKFQFPIYEINTRDIIQTFISIGNNSSIKHVQMRFDDSCIIRSANLNAFDLNDDCIVTHYTFLEKIESSGYPFAQEDCDKGLCFNTYQEALDYINRIKPKSASDKTYQSTINFIENLTADDFVGKKLVFSNVAVLEDSTYTLNFKNMYLKNGELFIILEKEKSLYDWGWQMILFDTFAFMVDETVNFDSIVTLF